MALYKEIVTKAIIGKGKKYFKNTYDLEVENIPSTVLGCWVINHKFKGYKTNDKIGVNGSYDVNICCKGDKFPDDEKLLKSIALHGYELAKTLSSKSTTVNKYLDKKLKEEKE